MRCLTRQLRRRPSRHVFRTSCQIVRERDFKLVADRIANLSTYGMLVTPADSVLTGERVIVSFRLPHVDRWIDAEATVTRVVHGRRPGEFSRGLGLEFDELRPFHRFLIRKELASCPPVPPTPRPGRRSTRAALYRLARA